MKCRSSTWRSHNRKLHERYAKGWWKGTHGSDVVALSTDTGEKRVRVQLACIEEAGEFFPPAQFPGGWHGILGLGYDYLGIVCSPNVCLIMLINTSVLCLFIGKDASSTSG